MSQVSADVNAGANANAGHSSTIEQSSLDEHHGAARNVVEEENAVYGTGRADPDLGQAMETHDKGLTEKMDGRSHAKLDPADDGRFKVGDENGPHDLKQHDLAASRQP